MTPEHTLYDTKNLPQVEEEEYYDASRFLLASCAEKYDEYLGQEVVQEKGIFLDKHKEKMLDFFGQFQDSGWMCFTTAATGPSIATRPLQFGPSTMWYLSSQIHQMDSQIRQLVADLPTGPPGTSSDGEPTLTSVSATQRAMCNRFDHMS